MTRNKKPSERIIVTAALARTFRRIRSEAFIHGAVHRAPVSFRFIVVEVCPGWTVSVRLFPDAFPPELPASEALKLQLASVALAARPSPRRVGAAA